MLKFLKNLFTVDHRSKKYKLVFSILFISYFLILVICLVGINFISSKDYYMLTPGEANKVEDVIEIDTIHDAGDVYTLSVFEFRKMSILQYLLAKAEGDVIVEEDYASFLTDKELTIQGNIMKENSITNSIIVAYKAASKINSNVVIDEYFSGAIVHTVWDYADSKIKQGDIITKVDQQILHSIDNYIDYIDAVLANTTRPTINVTVLRNGKELDLDLEIASTSSGRKIGISIYPHHVINSTSPKYTVHKSATSGPSGGLMQTIAIYNSLIAGDITKGKRFMGTGTIWVDGSVGPIGGVEQKIVTANNYKADYVFIPTDNYDDAINQYNLIKKPSYPKPIEVSSFDDVLKFFEGLGD